MNEEDRFLLLIHLVQQVSRAQLTASNGVPPYALTLRGTEAEPHSFFPGAASPSQNWASLFSAAVDEARREHDGPEVVGAAVCAGMVTGAEAEQAFGAQLETPGISRFVFFRYWRADDGWQIDEPQFLAELLVPEGLRWAPADRRRVPSG